jgi:uncharacterized protein YdhG (YjbR/CyaY superfamily)
MAKKETTAKRLPAKDIDEYLARLPPDARATLEKLRKTIRSAAPAATEASSYQIPTFKYQGSLVAFAAFPDHLSFYPMSPSVMEAYRDELELYETSKGTIRFSAARPLPAALVKKLVRARIEENETGVTR